MNNFFTANTDFIFDDQHAFRRAKKKLHMFCGAAIAKLPKFKNVYDSSSWPGKINYRNKKYHTTQKKKLDSLISLYVRDARVYHHGVQ